MDRGYIAIWRKIVEHPFAKEKRTFSKYEAWIDILMTVRYSKKPEDVVMGMTVLKCNYAESLKSIPTWARRWGWSESKVRRYFKLLENLGQIVTKSEGKTTRITVLNYSQYDPKRRDKGEKPKDDRHIDGEQAATEEEGKKEKKEIKIKLRTYLEGSIIHENHQCISDKIVEFFNYRMDKPKAKQYKTEKGINGLFRDLNGCKSIGLDLAECLEIAMENDWQTPKPDYFNGKTGGKPKLTLMQQAF